MSFATTFRACTAALSSRNLARPSVARSTLRLSTLGVRYYSEEKGKAPSESEQSKPADEQSSATSELETKLKAKESEVVDLTSRLRYLQADFLNLQRNSAREKEQTRDFAITKFAKDLLETVDVLSLALKSVPEGALKPSPGTSPTGKDHQIHLKELHEGVEITQRQLLQTLFKYHVTPYDPTGDAFDPNHHEAIYQAPVPGKEPGTVIDCQKVGYKIKDRVLRAAQVGVAQDAS
ncbi:GrpE-domain-containing protein [Panaeolus papilionaceus]|nr:GrpE-domain-containing protein [Panaeolus papilionaceus]